MTDRPFSMKSLENFEASLVLDASSLVDDGSIKLADATHIRSEGSPSGGVAGVGGIGGSSLPMDAALSPPAPQGPAALPGRVDRGTEASESTPHARWIGKRLAQFRIMRVLGQGAMGVVFQTEDVILKRIGALKVLRQQMKGEGQSIKVERFLLEARAAASIDHPCIAQVFEINQHDGWWYIAMEYMEGGSLHDLLKKTGPIPARRVALMLTDAARGLAAAHEAGVIHRDIKPGNLMLTRRGRCKVVDFGLVRLETGENLFGDDRAVLGTPHYIAPEVVLKQGAGGPSDVYSLAASAYVLLTGTPPFPLNDVEAIMRARVNADAPDVRGLAPSVPASMAELLRVALDRDPRKRPSAEVFAAAMQVESLTSSEEEAGSVSSSRPATSIGAASVEGSFAAGHVSSVGAGHGSMGPGSTAPGSAPIAAPTVPVVARRRLLRWAAVGAIVLLALVAAWWAITPRWTMSSTSSTGAAQAGSAPSAAASAARETMTNSIGMRLVSIPPGTFTMGSPAAEPDRNTDERMVQVTLTKPIFMSATEVTQQQWSDVMGADYAPPEGTHPNEAQGLRFLGPSLPAYSSWPEAKEFCRRLSAAEKKTYRLPTEAEWEYACRAGTTTAFSSGSSLDPSQAAFDAYEVTGKPSRPMAVATFPPNPWGLYDMHGNLMEWCADLYGEYPLGPLTDPMGTGKDRLRVLRGGSWDTPARVARSANRWTTFPEVRTDYIGFRVVLEPGAAFVAEAAPPLVPKAEPKHIPLDASDAHKGDHVEVDRALPEYKPEVVLSQRLRSVGSDTMDRLVRLWELEFQRSHPGLMIKHEGRGSGTAPRALAEAIAHIGPMSRPLNDAEKREFLAQQGYEPTQIVVAFDALAVYVNASNPVATRGLSLEEIDALFSSTRKRGGAREINTWGDLGLGGGWASRPVTLLGRNRASGTFSVFRELVLKGGEYRPNMLELIGSAEVVDRAAEEPGAVGFSGIGYARPEVRAVPIVTSPGTPPVEPVMEHVRSGVYPLARSLYLTFDMPPAQPPTAWQKEFLRFVLSKRGQELVVQAGFFPLDAERAAAQLRAAGIEGATRPQER